MNILVTGATGFVGGPTCRRLLAGGHRVVAAVRRADPALPARIEIRRVAALGPDTDWRAALDGVEAVIHLAARAHVMAEHSADPVALFRRVNGDGTLCLAAQAAAAGVKRFVFVSSVKVNGEATPIDRPFRADDEPAPADAYGISKAEAEAGLAEIASSTGLSLAVIRPPLVHGPGTKGNLALLLKAIRLGLPLPLGAIRNRRSLIGVDNLADALAFLVAHPAEGCFLIRDGDDVSTPELVRALAQVAGRPPRLVPVPPPLLRLVAAGLGRSALYQRLAGSLAVDDSPLRQLGWAPPFTLAEGLARVA